MTDIQVSTGDIVAYVTPADRLFRKGPRLASVVEVDGDTITVVNGDDSETVVPRYCVTGRIRGLR